MNRLVKKLPEQHAFGIFAGLGRLDHLRVSETGFLLGRHRLKIRSNLNFSLQTHTFFCCDTPSSPNNGLITVGRNGSKALAMASDWAGFGLMVFIDVCDVSLVCGGTAAVVPGLFCPHPPLSCGFGCGLPVFYDGDFAAKKAGAV